MPCNTHIMAIVSSVIRDHRLCDVTTHSSIIARYVLFLLRDTMLADGSVAKCWTHQAQKGLSSNRASVHQAAKLASALLRAAYRRFMTHVTCRLTAKNRDQLRNPAVVAFVFDLIEFGFIFVVNTDSDSLANRMVWIRERGRV